MIPERIHKLIQFFSAQLGNCDVVAFRITPSADPVSLDDVVAGRYQIAVSRPAKQCKYVVFMSVDNGRNRPMPQIVHPTAHQGIS